MWLYAGMFWAAFATLVFEITLTRLLSVITWYYLAFFAVAVAMLGMTAGAIRVYLQPTRFVRQTAAGEAATACLGFALSVPVSLVVLCLIPLEFSMNTMFVLGAILDTLACAAPFYFSGIALSLLLSKPLAPVGKLYAADLLGASLGCVFVLAALAWLDAPSLLLLTGVIAALAAWCLRRAGGGPKLQWRTLSLLAVLALAAMLNRSQYHGVRPLFVKGRMEPSSLYLYEKWNSFSRVTCYHQTLAWPQLWGPSEVFQPEGASTQYFMNIDGAAGTSLRQFHQPEDIQHLRYDVTSVAHYLRPTGKACVIGVGGARDIQCALLFGHKQVLGIELNPIFVDLLKRRFHDFAGIDRPGVRLVVDEARSYLSRSTERFDLLQMSLIDTWAATGAGAYSLSENAIYTVEAWKVFLSRLSEKGIFTVSRWHSERELGETGRIVSLAVAALLDMGVKDPRSHLMLVTNWRLSTLLIRRTPFDAADIQEMKSVCAQLHYKLAIVPGEPAEQPILESVLSASSRDDLNRRVSNLPLNYEPPTDEQPYFFNMLRLRSVLPAIAGVGPGRQSPEAGQEVNAAQGVVAGNLNATTTLLELIGLLGLLTLASIILPVWVASRGYRRNARQRRLLWTGGLYFSLIGAGFMLLEISLVQRLSLYLSHPVYALGVLLSSIIAATGVGSYLSEQLPLTRRPWRYLFPLATGAMILALHPLVSRVIAATIVCDQPRKILLSVAMIAPMGVLLGFFFPTGMRLFARISERDIPWFWAMNGTFGVLCSAVAVFISIFIGVSVNFYLSAACYLATLPVLLIL